MSTTRALTAQQAAAAGGRTWTHPQTGATRVYLPDTVIAEAIGLEYERYRSGNIWWATLRGAKLSNARATNLLGASCWVEDDTLHVQLRDSRDVTPDQLADAIVGWCETHSN